MNIDLKYIFGRPGDKVQDQLDLGIPTKSGERLQLVIDWTLSPAPEINQQKYSNFDYSRHSTAQLFHESPQQA